MKERQQCFSLYDVNDEQCLKLFKSDRNRLFISALYSALCFTMMSSNCYIAVLMIAFAISSLAFNIQTSQRAMSIKSNKCYYLLYYLLLSLESILTFLVSLSLKHYVFTVSIGYILGELVMKGKGGKIPINQRGEYLKQQRMMESKNQMEQEKVPLNYIA
jgi:hypothetical protein